VWGDPVCSSKIAEKRRRELERLLEFCNQAGLTVLHLAYTTRHHKGQSCEEVLERISKARKLMMNRKSFKRVARLLGIVGSVRASEVTWGENGWHPHFHELLILKTTEEVPGYFTWLDPSWVPGKMGITYKLAQADPMLIENELFPLWRQACVDSKAGEPDRAHGVRIKRTDKGGAGYVAKWGAALEMTKGHIKKGQGENYTPWDFLRNFEPGPKGETWARLFREYFRAFKGKRQLVWSEGLKDLVGIKDETDKEAARAVDSLDPVIATIEFSDWRVILAADKRGELLEVAWKEFERNPAEAEKNVKMYIQSLWDSYEYRQN
jgi:hypothetical protein